MKVKRMGLFDKLAGTRNIELNPKSALVLTALTVIAADGVIDEAEMLDLAKIVRGDQKSIDDAVRVLKTNSLEGSIDLVTKCLNEKQKLATLAIVIDIAMADGVLAENEQKLIQMYINRFGISEDLLKPIFDTVAIKNDFSIFK
jgi:uncharacterized tellurite resistance protein B-like protein